MAFRRVAIVGGLRTPFVKANTVFASLNAIDLGRLLVQEVVQRFDLDATPIDQLVFGQLLPGVRSSSLAQDIAIAVGLPKSIDAQSIAPSTRAVTALANAIALGQAEMGIAGGADSMSNAPVFASPALAQALIGAAQSTSVLERLRSFQGLSGKDLLPVRVAAATTVERRSGDDDVMPLAVPPAFEVTISRDDADGGPFDGAAAIVLMSEEKARALGLQPLAFIRSFTPSASDLEASSASGARVLLDAARSFAESVTVDGLTFTLERG